MIDTGFNLVAQAEYRGTALQLQKIIKDDVEYHAYLSDGTGKALVVINHTKELLEIELMRKDLAHLEELQKEYEANRE